MLRHRQRHTHHPGEGLLTVIFDAADPVARAIKEQRRGRRHRDINIEHVMRPLALVQQMLERHELVHGAITTQQFPVPTRELQRLPTRYLLSCRHSYARGRNALLERLEIQDTCKRVAGSSPMYRAKIRPFPGPPVSQCSIDIEFHDAPSVRLGMLLTDLIELGIVCEMPTLDNNHWWIGEAGRLSRRFAINVVTDAPAPKTYELIKAVVDNHHTRAHVHALGCHGRDLRAAS